VNRRSNPYVTSVALGLFIAGAGCQPARDRQNASGKQAALDTAAGAGSNSRLPPAPSQPQVYSAFGNYSPLPDWSGWCGLQPDASGCSDALKAAVETQTPKSRPTVRQHGWQLWPALWAPIALDKNRNDAHEQRTNLYGTQGCWSQFADGTPACSGVYPIWLTWPNTGSPYQAAASKVNERAQQPSASTTPSPAQGTTLRTRRQAYAQANSASNPDPTKTQTVNTQSPKYKLPALVLFKQCGIPLDTAESWLKGKQYLDIVQACNKAGAPDVFCTPVGDNAPAICDGTAFVNQGDVMIATESLSAEGYDEIQNNKLYNQATLQQMYAEQTGNVSASISPRFISTKHMFWPVKGCKPGVKVGEKGCRVRYGALPPWVPKDFKQYDYATNADYLGYEQWKNVAAIDTCKSTDPATPCAKGGSATLALAHVSGAHSITTQQPQVYPSEAFIHVQVSEQVLNSHFTATDRALLDQATIWAYGDASNGFEPGDFLVLAALHVNTKELSSWAFQSVWWSPMSDTLEACPLGDYNHCFGQTGAYAATNKPGDPEPNPYSGLTREQLLAVDSHVGKTWRDNYLMTDSYGIRYELDGTPVKTENYFKAKAPTYATQGPDGQHLDLLPVSANVYIEPVIHPLGTDCQNCHRRAAYPGTACAANAYPTGCGQTSYQTAQCADLLGDYGDPNKDLCMTKPWAWHTTSGDTCTQTNGTLCNGKTAFPVVATDWIWIIASGHVQPRPQ
jgi:hypothetical protein